MVSSKINPEVNYEDNKILHPEDVGHQTSMYIIDIHDISTLVVLGKPKYTYSAKGVLYYPVYVVANDKVKSQIGVFETKLTDTLNIYDEEGDIDIDKFDEILLYGFVTKRYIEKSNTNPTDYIEKSEKEFEMEQKRAQREEEDRAEKEKEEKRKDEESDEMDALQLKVSKMKVSSEKEKIDSIIEDGVFTVDRHFKQPALLEEETEEDADKIKKEYKESARNEWIEKFMKNSHYGLIDNEGKGDCLFAVIRDAYEHIGYKTTVAKLRAVVAANLTESVFEENRKLFLDFENSILSLQKEIKDIKHTNTLYAQRMKKTTTKEERDKIIEDTKHLEPLYKAKNIELKDTKAMQENYVGFMKDIDTMDKYREYILTSHFWADSWAISTLEKVLEMKLIILSEEAYKHKAYDNVLNCGEINKDIQEKKGFTPKFYIMTSYDGAHYKLITYKRKHIFTFGEVPYDVKILIVNKCLEKNSGVYYMIQEFRNFKSRLGLDPDEGNPEEDELDDIDSDLYNKSVVFVFHSKSLNTAKPGKGSNEKIEESRRNEFAILSKIKDWRRKLDDSWADAPFHVERHRWASVEHYVQASKFKKGYPDFYAQFSLDNPSDLSKDVELARGVANLANKKYNSMRPENIKIDVDYNLGRDLEERETAIYAKFSQNQDLKEMLLATKDALLKQYLRRKPAEADMILMKVRNRIRIEA
jgi:predicted NAD-dependent protein-ADP-ribosyltransferase YbiA (DUF1768 family)